jgi:hypothetical protein
MSAFREKSVALVHESPLDWTSGSDGVTLPTIIALAALMQCDIGHIVLGVQHRRSACVWFAE